MKKAKKKELGKRELKAVLETPLANIRIRKIQIWAQKPNNPNSSIPRPKTIGDFVKMFPYEVPSGRRIHGSEFRWVLHGLGSKTVTRLKRKLQRLGVTPDIWPALLHRKEFLGSLSKGVICGIPVKIIFPNMSDWELGKYLKCRRAGEVEGRTMADFFRLDPTKDPWFFARHRHKITQVRLLLAERGFTEADGAFFRWNPHARSLKKAMRIFRGRGLSKETVRIVAQIVVAEGLV